MKTKRLLLVAGFLAACICLPLGAVAMIPSGRGVTTAKLEQIKYGMAKEEVEDIFGEQGTEEWMGVNSFIWQRDNGGSVAINFDSDNTVRHVFRHDPETTFQKIRRWLGFSPSMPSYNPPYGYPKQAFDSHDD